MASEEPCTLSPSASSGALLVGIGIMAVRITALARTRIARLKVPN